VAPELRDITVDLVTTGPRCEAASLWMVAGRAAVAPGYGRPALRDGRKRARFAVGAIAIGAVVASQWQNNLAKEQYRKYLDPLTVDFVGTFVLAERARLRATVLSAVGIGTWVAQGLIAVRNERAFEQRLRTTSAVSATRTGTGLSWRPVLEVHPRSMALGLSFAW
jgi:hypothetical protein